MRVQPFSDLEVIGETLLDSLEQYHVRVHEVVSKDVQEGHHLAFFLGRKVNQIRDIMTQEHLRILGVIKKLESQAAIGFDFHP